MISKTGYWEASEAPAHHIHSPELSKWICNFLNEDKNKTIIDFGCGMGHYLRDLHLNDYNNLLGVEGDPPYTDYPFKIITQDISVPFSLERIGNVICLEVGEHIPKEFQNSFIDNITKHCDNYLIMSWALHNQGGDGHFNELDNNVVIAEIEKRGFIYLEEFSVSARNCVEDFCCYFRNTIMIFKKNPKVTFTITSCNRLDLLKQTIDSFDKNNTYPIDQWIMTDDSFDESIAKQLDELYGNRFTIIHNNPKIGLCKSLDLLFNGSNNEYIFHCEDDWLFEVPGFIETSLKILEINKDVHQVWVRHKNETANTYYEDGTIKPWSFDHWKGFTFNPGLRRKSDYLKMFKDGFTKLGSEIECSIHANTFDYKAISIKNTSCKHIGNGRHTTNWID
jgi:hypothetical protein